MRKTTLLLLVALLIPATLVLAQPWDGRGRGDCDGSRMVGGRGMHCDMGPGKGFGRGIGMGEGMPGMLMLLRNADEIGLTDDQKTKIEEMSTRFQTERIDKEAELEKARVALRALMMKDDAAQADVMGAIDRVTVLEGEMKKMRYSHYTAMRGLLTPEQQDKIKQLRTERRKDRWDDRDDQRGMGMGMRRGMQGGN